MPLRIQVLLAPCACFPRFKESDLSKPRRVTVQAEQPQVDA
jgi:hypothetical protein